MAISFIVSQSRAGRRPNPNPNARSFAPNGRDVTVGPSYTNLRGNTSVVSTTRGALDPESVRMYGVNPHNRGWFR